MNATQPHFALRELRQHLSQRSTAVVLGAVAVLLAISGPFDTGAEMGLVARLAYWGSVVLITYALGFLATSWVETRWPGQPFVLRWMGRSLATALLVGSFVLGLNFAAFGILPASVMSLVLFAVDVLLISGVLHLGMMVFPGAAPQEAPAAPARLPALLARLPLDKRGTLLSLHVQDHYVQVTTTAGQHLVLMRLRDAILETDPVPGLQVHRSHWVNSGEVRAARRDGDRGWVTLSDGRDIPVSRGHIKDLIAAGLLT